MSCRPERVNLVDTDLWESDVMVPTSCALTNKRPMAEYVLASFLHLSRGLHRSYGEKRRRRFDHQTYNPVMLREDGIHCRRRGPSAENWQNSAQRLGCASSAPAAMPILGALRHEDLRGLESAGALHDLLRESEFVAICCPWTEATTHLIDRAALRQ